MEGFTIEGWDDFVENFSKFVDKWADKKKILLQRMANIYHGEVIPHVPVDTSRLVDSITIFGEGIPHDFVEVGTNVEYALYVNDGHVQHKRFLPADKLSVGGKAKYLKNRQIKVPYVSGVSVDTTQSNGFASKDNPDPDTRAWKQSQITYTDGLKAGDMVLVQKLNDNNKYVIIARVVEA